MPTYDKEIGDKLEGISMKKAGEIQRYEEDNSPPSLEVKPAQWVKAHGTFHVTPPSEIFALNSQV